MMTHGALLRIGVVLFAFGCGLLTDANIGRIMKDGTVVRSAEAGGYGGGGQAGVAGSGWGGSGGSAGRQPPGGTYSNDPSTGHLYYTPPGRTPAYKRQPTTTVRPSVRRTTTATFGGGRTARRTIRRTGVYIATLPRNCIRTTMHGYSVWRCGGVYYQPHGGRYVLVRF
jgi:hypothetical protein